MDTRTADDPNVTAPNFFWPTVGRPGVVPLWALVPTPNQPRQYFDPTELALLADTIKKGGQREILTVRELTDAEKEKYSPARYMIKSGERRWRGAGEAGLSGVEIRVKYYVDEAAEALDTWMLNEQRAHLSDIENARYMVHLTKLHDWQTQAEIATGMGKDVFWVSQHQTLMKLSPKAMARMEPWVEEAQRFVRGVGVFLGRLTHDVQDQLVESLPKECTVGARQVAWMSDQLKAMGVEQETRSRSPEKIRRRILKLSDRIVREADGLLDASDLGKIFINTIPSERRDLLRKLREAHQRLGNLLTRTEELSVLPQLTKQDERIEVTSTVKPPPAPAPVQARKPTPAAVEDKSQRSAEAFIAKTGRVETSAPPRTTQRQSWPRANVSPAPLQPVVKGVKLAPVTPAPTMYSQTPPRPLQESPHESESPQATEARKIREWARKGITLNAYRDGRFPLVTLTPYEYLAELDKAEKGVLEFQVKKKSKPEHLPTRAQAIEAAKLTGQR